MSDELPMDAARRIIEGKPQLGDREAVRECLGIPPAPVADRHCEHGWLFQCDYCERVGLCREPSRAWAVESAAAVGWMVKDSGLCRCPGCAKQL